VSVRPITAGPTEGQLTAVEQGLQAGERVVTDGVDRIREGARVEVIDPTRPATERARDAPPGGGRSAEQREAFKKKMEGMTPEQREEFRKRRQSGEAAKDNAPK
jgi:multidrug efflux system membrane fusion protein